MKRDRDLAGYLEFLGLTIDQFETIITPENRTMLLELGTGRGIALTQLTELYPDSIWVGVDLNPHNLHNSKPSVLNADICQLPFSDSQFGCIFSIASAITYYRPSAELHYQNKQLLARKSIRKQVNEMSRLLCTGGHLVLGLMRTDNQNFFKKNKDNIKIMNTTYDPDYDVDIYLDEIIDIMSSYKLELDSKYSGHNRLPHKNLVLPSVGLVFTKLS